MFRFYVDDRDEEFPTATLVVKNVGTKTKFQPEHKLPSVDSFNPNAESGSVLFHAWNGRVEIRWNPETVWLTLSSHEHGMFTSKMPHKDQSLATALQDWIAYEQTLTKKHNTDACTASKESDSPNKKQKPNLE